jgi:hypothetical protein
VLCCGALGKVPGEGGKKGRGRRGEREKGRRRRIEREKGRRREEEGERE